MIEKKKQKKRSEQTAVEIQELEKNIVLLDALVEDKKKLLDLKIEQLRSTEGKLKKDTIIEVGEFIEKHHIYETHKISGQLKKRFKGYISKFVIWDVCKEKKHWVDMTHGAYGHRGKNQYTNQSISDENQAQKHALNQQQLDYIKAHEDEKRRYRQISDLIESLTELSIADQGRIVGETQKGEDFRKKFAEASRDYWLKVSKQMIKSDIEVTLGDLRTLVYIAEKFGDVLYDELETRKRKAHLESA